MPRWPAPTPAPRLNTRPSPPRIRILRAAHLGMCFGVRDAIQLAEREAARRPLTVLGQLVHNEAVLANLRSKGVGVVDAPENIQTPAAMITAHGASDRRIEQVRARGHEVIEATCPLVHFAHSALRQLVSEGYHPIIVGKRGHVEVRGMTEDLDAAEVVASFQEIDRLPERSRYGVMAQTTQPIAFVRQCVERLRARFPQAEVRFIDTVCRPTKQRQSAAVSLAKECDLVLVVGGANSNNTRELAETCREHCAHVYHVQTAADLRPGWLKEPGVRTVGLTAGTSTPDVIIDAVEQRVKEWIESEDGDV